MPDLIRHPETLENTGFRLSPERRLFIKTVVYGQTLINIIADKRFKQMGLLRRSKTRHLWEKWVEGIFGRGDDHLLSRL